MIKPILAVLIVILTYAYFFTVLWLEQKSNLIILTAIVGFVSTCVGYYLGASSGSARKDETIANQLQK
ncbi:MAG: hypothetical protein H7221_10410 [Flavobacterium sp.]|nr:hypothetical protein [Flavobacterium sp.]